MNLHTASQNQRTRLPILQKLAQKKREVNEFYAHIHCNGLLNLPLEMCATALGNSP